MINPYDLPTSYPQYPVEGRFLPLFFATNPKTMKSPTRPKSAWNPNDERKHPINLELTTTDYALLKRFADQDIRSIRSYVMALLLKHLHERARNTPPN